MEKFKQKMPVFIVCLILAISLLVQGCQQNAPEHTEIKDIIFIDGSHERTDDFSRTFDTQYTEFENLKIAFETGLYDESELSKISKSIYSDYAIIADFFNAYETVNNIPLNIYIVENTVVGGSYIAGKNVYCRTDDVLTGDYRIPLIQYYSSAKQPWISYGLNSVIFNDNEGYDNAVLTEYYQSSEDISILSLYGTRFYEDWNTDEAINIAKQTASSLTKYILNNYSYETLFDVSDQIKTQWLHYIGVDKEYIDPYDSILHNFEYTKTQHYSMVIKSDTVNYYLYIFEDLLNSVEAEEFIYRDTVTKAYVIDYLKSNVIENSHVMNYDASYSYYIKQGSINGVHGDSIYLWSKAYHIYETANVIISGQGEKHWQYRGIAEYISKYVCRDNYVSQRFSNYMHETAKKLESGENDIDAYDMQAIKCYLLNEGEWENYTDFDFRLYADSVSYITLFADEDFGSTWASTSIHDLSGKSGVAWRLGNELSHAQALSFTAFLIEQYSLDTFIGFCQSGSDFEEVFGKHYSSLKIEWMDYLEAIGSVMIDTH